MSNIPDSHCCAVILAGVTAGHSQLTGRLQETQVQCPAVPATKGTVAVRAAGPLDKGNITAAGAVDREFIQEFI